VAHDGVVPSPLTQAKDPINFESGVTVTVDMDKTFCKNMAPSATVGRPRPARRHTPCLGLCLLFEFRHIPSYLPLAWRDPRSTDHAGCCDPRALAVHLQGQR
jgi:hypothetical protein